MWKPIIYENLVDKHLVEKSLKMGYKDFKRLLYGGKDSGPLSLSLSLPKAGPMFICETPGIWGKLPDGFGHLWENNVDVYVTMDVANKAAGFDFDKTKAHKYELYYEKKSLEICAQIRQDATHVEVPPGEHVLTLVPHGQHKIILAWLVTA